MKKRKVFLLTLIVVSALFCFSACKGDSVGANKDWSESTTDSAVKEYKKYPSGTGIEFMEFGPLVPDEVYTTPAKENGLGGEVYMLMGSVEEYFFEGDYAYIRLDTLNGDIVITDPVEMIRASEMGDTLGEIDYAKLRSYYPLPEVGEFATIFGEYQGLSEKFECANFIYASEDYMLEALLNSVVETTEAPIDEQSQQSEEPATTNNPVVFEGSGNKVLTDIQLSDNRYKVYITYEGNSVFSVFGYDADDDMVIMESSYGACNKETVLRQAKFPLILEITANGNWKIEFEKID